jgi:hypothetical protein
VSGKCLHDPDELVAFVALDAGEGEQLACPVDDRAACRRTADTHSHSSPELEEPLVAECSQRTQDRVRVHTHHRRQVPGGGKSFAGLGVAFSDRPAYLPSHLNMERGRVGAVHTRENHAINTSVISFVWRS